MNIAVVGAAGRTGSAVVEQALDQGHEVVAVTRGKSPELVAASSRQASMTPRTRSADILDRAAVTRALDGVEAVISTVGIGSSRAFTEVYSAGTRNLLSAMSTVGARRLLVVSAAPAGPRDQQPALERFMIMPMLDRFFGSSYEDMRRMESILQDSGLAWTALRPPRLLDRPARGSFRLNRGPLPRARSMTIPDLAAALLSCLDRPDTERQALFVAN
jgi:putative NADH-flavin reductase